MRARNIKKIGNDQELVQLNPTSHSQNKMERNTHTKINKHSRQTGMVNRMNSSFPNRWLFSYPNLNSSSIYFYLLCFKLQNKTNRKQMGSCYSGEDSAREQIHTDMTMRSIEEPHQKYMKLQNPFKRIQICLSFSWLNPVT